MSVATAATLGEVGLIRSALILSWRSLLQFFRTPQMTAITLVNGVLYVLIFRYVFGGAIRTGNETYVDLLIPAVMLVSVFYAASQIAVGVAEEKALGFYDRIKTLPIPRTAPLFARVLTMVVLLTVSYGINLAVGFAVGFRPAWSVEGALVATGLVVGFAFALGWMFVALGLLAKSAQVASSYALALTPVAFVSGAFVPVGTMPSWMEPIAKNQPFSVLVEAVRGQVLVHYANAADPLLAAAWLVVILVVFAPLAVWLYSRI